MPSDHYIHPEFGYLAPTPRFGRELRVGLLSMLFGMSFGVIAVSGVGLGNRDHDRSCEATSTAHDIVAGSAMQTGGNDSRLEVAPARIGTSDPSSKHPDSDIGVSKPDPNPGRMGNSVLAVKQVCQGDVDVSCSSKGEHVGSRPRPLPRITGSPAIARLPLGRSGPSTSGTSPADVRLDFTPAKPIAKQAPAPASIESIALPREKQKKKTRNQNASQEEINSQKSRESSGNISTARAQESHTRRLGRPSARDNAASPRGFWAWSP